MSAKILQFRQRMGHKPLKAKSIPVSEEMLYAVRDQILAEMRSLFKAQEARFEQIDAQFERMEARFEQIDARFEQMEARFEQIDSRFAKVESKIEKLSSEIHYQTVLIEQQAAENRFVLDGYANLYDRQDRVEEKLDLVLKALEELKNSKPFGSA